MSEQKSQKRERLRRALSNMGKNDTEGVAIKIGLKTIRLAKEIRRREIKTQQRFLRGARYKG